MHLDIAKPWNFEEECTKTLRNLGTFRMNALQTLQTPGISVEGSTKQNCKNLEILRTNALQPGDHEEEYTKNTAKSGDLEDECTENTAQCEMFADEC